MPTDKVMRIVTAVASALDYAHKQGLLHRDVKPANIMLTHLDDDDDEQRILLADFGIARNVDDISGLTATNMTVGTMAYAAPEQLMGEELDGRAGSVRPCRDGLSPPHRIAAVPAFQCRSRYQPTTSTRRLRPWRTVARSLQPLTRCSQRDSPRTPHRTGLTGAPTSHALSPSRRV